MLADGNLTYHLFELALAGTPLEAVESFTAKTFYLDINQDRVPITLMIETNPQEAYRIRVVFRYPPDYLKTPTFSEAYGGNLPRSLSLRAGLSI